MRHLRRQEASHLIFGRQRQCGALVGAHSDGLSWTHAALWVSSETVGRTSPFPALPFPRHLTGVSWSTFRLVLWDS